MITWSCGKDFIVVACSPGARAHPRIGARSPKPPRLSCEHGGLSACPHRARTDVASPDTKATRGARLRAAASSGPALLDPIPRSPQLRRRHW
jgi:hypothetical protein